jgi:hypothetical protein
MQLGDMQLCDMQLCDMQPVDMQPVDVQLGYMQLGDMQLGDMQLGDILQLCSQALSTNIKGGCQSPAHLCCRRLAMIVSAAVLWPGAQQLMVAVDQCLL